MSSEGPDRTIIRTADGRDLLRLIISFDLQHWVEWIGEWGISRAAFVSILFFALLGALSLQVPNLGTYTTEWLAGTSPVWLPIGLGVGAWKVWIWYVRALGFSKQKHIVLEMKVPREITRSPRAMELALTNLWTNSGETTIFHRWWKGQTRSFYSLEMVSFGGEVHFFIWLREKDRNTVEFALYAQYPEIELHEVEDYASKFEFDPNKYMCFATDHTLEPRSDAFPIKTYVDFELDKDPKEEYRVDPLAYILEFMSSLKPQEQVWVQIIFTLNKDKRRKHGVWMGSESLWEGLVRDEVKKIRKESSVNPNKENAPESDERKYGFPRPTWKETEQLRTMERNLGKLPFSVGVRGIYIAEKKYFSSANYNGVRWLWRPFGNPLYLNQLRPRRYHNPFDYPWQDFHGIRWSHTTRRFLDAYRRRSWFYAPWITPHNIMTAEVMATLWHPPSSSIAAPGLERIPAKKAEPPSNLPM